MDWKDLLGKLISEKLGYRVATLTNGEHIDQLLTHSLQRLDRDSSYPRVLSSDEKVFMTVEAFDYLLQLARLGTIDHEQLEKILSLCFVMNSLHHMRITPHIVQQISDMVLFLKRDEFSLPEMLSMFHKLEPGTDRKIPN